MLLRMTIAIMLIAGSLNTASAEESAAGVAATGLGTFGADVDCLEDKRFVGRADELMYRSKQAGRNRVTIG